MASAETQTEIIQLVVGMVGAAPGATILAELSDIVDAGASIEDLAIAIAENPAFSGDTGLFPDFFPNEIFATNWLAAFLGDTVSDANMDLAIEAVTALLNAGSSRGEVMYAVIVAVAAIDVTDPDFGDAAAQLANQTEVAEYYSITVAQDGADLDALKAAIAGVDETAASVTTGEAAVDTLIAANADVAGLITNLDAANDALAGFLVIADGDGNPLTSATEAGLIAFAGFLEGTTLEGLIGGASNYAGASDSLKAALIADQQVVDAGILTGANTVLATAVGTTTGTGSQTGLVAAIAVLDAAIDTSDAAIEASALAQVDADSALASYNVLNTGTIGFNTNGTTDDGTTIVLSGTSLVLGTGVTETTDPGVTALLAATQANEVAEAAEISTLAAANSALDTVENLDQTGARTTELGTVAGLMNFITEATTAEPTDAEMDAEQAALDAGVAQLNADIAALLFDTDETTTEANHAVLTAAAVTAGFINAGDATALDGAFDGATTITDQITTDGAILASQTALPTNNLGADFTTAVGVYLGLGTTVTAAMPLVTAVALAPLALAADIAATAVAAAQTTIDTLSDTLALEALTLGAIGIVGDLNDDITDATAAFADAGFAVPVLLDTAVVAATAADDLFLTADSDSQIISFSSDDTLFIGDDLTLNTDTTAGDEGDNAVLEVWITGTTDATITIETSVFGSDAADPELYTIILLGVAAADVSFADGFISVA